MTSTESLVQQMLRYVKVRHPRSLQGVLESRATDPRRFDEYAELLLTWADRALGPGFLEHIVDSFVVFSNDVNFAQARYEVARRYDAKTYRECEEKLYSQTGSMNTYLAGIYLTNVLWAHHLELSTLFVERFVADLPVGARMIEIASGHGAWGLMALHWSKETTLDAYDISPAAIDMASGFAKAAGLAGRASYQLENALNLPVPGQNPWDACVCSFLIEHLERPDELLAVVASVLRPGGKAFLTAALTAAQDDHIFEFRRESEVMLLAEHHGMRVLDMRSAGPRRTLPQATFLPRSVAFVLQKRVHDTW